MISVEQLEEMLGRCSLIVDAQTLHDGSLRFATIFLHANDEYVDLRLYRDGDSPNSLILSDFGDTIDYLRDVQLNPWATKKRHKAIEFVCESLGVAIDGNLLLVRLSEDELPNLADAVIQLSHACIRITDMTLYSHPDTPKAIRNEIHELLDELLVEIEQPTAS
ncbi:MAG: DUF1828 domain-containing protein [Candidatus Poribacteria bacterium]|nr:DUF1828 domain-containing protein [Candidatus Poribacteria bacterium]